MSPWKKTGFLPFKYSHIKWNDIRWFIGSVYIAFPPMWSDGTDDSNFVIAACTLGSSRLSGWSNISFFAASMFARKSIIFTILHEIPSFSTPFIHRICEKRKKNSVSFIYNLGYTEKMKIQDKRVIVIVMEFPSIGIIFLKWTCNNKRSCVGQTGVYRVFCLYFRCVWHQQFPDLLLCAKVSLYCFYSSTNTTATHLSLKLLNWINRNKIRKNLVYFWKFLASSSTFISRLCKRVFMDWRPLFILTYGNVIQVEAS